MPTQAKTQWKMPLWMEKYIPMMTNSSSKTDIEYFINQEYQSCASTFFSGQVELLQKLHDKRLI